MSTLKLSRPTTLHPPARQHWDTSFRTAPDGRCEWAPLSQGLKLQQSVLDRLDWHARKYEYSVCQYHASTTKSGCFVIGTPMI
jgi:hypothetical protein